jgi:hypothetical protein
MISIPITPNSICASSLLQIGQKGSVTVQRSDYFLVPVFWGEAIASRDSWQIPGKYGTFASFSAEHLNKPAF